MEQVAKLLEQLATKLGTTVEYLWSILIKQAFISGIHDLLFVLLGIILGIGTWKLHKFFLKEESCDEGSPLIIIFLLTIISLALVFGGLYFAATAFFNPEYWALKEILDTVGGK